MEAFAASYIERFQERVASFSKTVDGLSPEALDWSPGADMNSLTVLVAHSVGAVRYMIGDLIAGDDSSRVRAEEFLVQGLTSEELRTRLENVAGYVQKIVGGISRAQLGETRFSPQHDSTFTVMMCLLRALDHMVEHLGHAEMTRLLWEQQVKPN